MYIPPSQYKTGFYSYQQYSLNGEPYTGPYWELLNGEKYTGDSPSDDSQLLSPPIIPIEDESTEEKKYTDQNSLPPNTVIIAESNLNQ